MSVGILSLARKKAPRDAGDLQLVRALPTLVAGANSIAHKRGGPIDVTLPVDGDEVAKGTVELSIPLAFTASETFDIGSDLGSPVSASYYDAERSEEGKDQ